MGSILKIITNVANFNVNQYPTLFLSLVIIFETVVSYLIIQKVPYTEIDWIAYMQEVGGVINGDYNYINLRGNTGPLVYPAGFVYIYSFLYYLTDSGVNILCAQYIFLLLHVTFIYIFIKLLMLNTSKLPLWVIVLTSISYRIHSIFVLRLFNDCFAVFFCYISLLIFTFNKNDNYALYWYIGSIIYSFAVSIKMNILLYAPAIGLLYFKYLGFIGTIKQVSICILTQVLLGTPFLIRYPMSYINRAFNFSKDFEYKWSVNFKFISEELFLNKKFGFFLLSLLVLFLLLTANVIWCAPEGGLFKYIIKYWNKNNQSKSKKVKKTKKKIIRKWNSWNVPGTYFLDRFFLCNFLGIVFAKSLHFQFYVWYFHSIPYLAWRSSLPLFGKFILILYIEFIWNIFPSNYMSSVCLLIAHLILLFFVLHFQYHEYAVNYRKKKQ